jgi:hypothetical protein
MISYGKEELLGLGYKDARVLIHNIEFVMQSVRGRLLRGDSSPTWYRFESEFQRSFAWSVLERKVMAQIRFDARRDK